MNFITLDFFVLLIPVYIIYWSLPSRFHLITIAISSLLFYSLWNPLFAIHLGIFILLNYFVSRKVMESSRSSIWFKIGVGLNLGNLLLFKYFYFFTDILLDITANPIFSKTTVHEILFETFGFTEIILPLAISFYTFQIMAYLVDVRRKKISSDPGITAYFAFILFFPQLVAGPIMRHSDFFHQIKGIHFDSKKGRMGIFLFLSGLFRKVIIADNLSYFINDVFHSPEKYDAVSNAVAPVGFAMQVYADFSGYTSMARGIALLFGIELPANFRGPFLSENMQEFWRRWHITLSTWLRDYIYIPLGGAKIAEWRTSLSLMATFTLGGIWHGAGYNFLLWGIYHGLFLILFRITKKNPILKSFSTIPLATPLRILGTFLIFSGSMIFFRGEDIGKSMNMWYQVFFSVSTITNEFNINILSLLPPVFILNWLDRVEWKRRLSNRTEWILLYFVSILLVILIGVLGSKSNDFIYFQF